MLIGHLMQYVLDSNSIKGYGEYVKLALLWWIHLYSARAKPVQQVKCVALDLTHLQYNAQHYKKFRYYTHTMINVVNVFLIP
jgi:hypothetical protein